MSATDDLQTAFNLLVTRIRLVRTAHADPDDLLDCIGCTCVTVV